MVLTFVLWSGPFYYHITSNNTNFILPTQMKLFIDSTHLESEIDAVNKNISDTSYSYLFAHNANQIESLQILS